MLKEEAMREMALRIVPFWLSLRDGRGGFYGYVGHDLRTDTEADKGCILNSRILWFFSEAYRVLGRDTLLMAAQHAYTFLARAFWDEEQGGVYWSVHADGTPADTTKHTYAQAFALYGLAAFYGISHDEGARRRMYDLFDLVETKCREGMDYGEAYDRHWRRAGNEKLSENGVEAARTMNTLLHIFEAYAQMYEATKEPRVGEAMRSILDTFLTKIYNPARRRLEVFFDADWHSLIDLHSYGHDIEASWLLEWGCEMLGDEELKKRLEEMTSVLTEEVLQKALHGDVVWNECEKGVDDKTQVWWVQAEAVNGFLNRWQKTGEEKYLNAAKAVWGHIRHAFCDCRAGGEWFWSLDEHGAPIPEKPIVEPWKCPYHNGRTCLEMIRRLPENV